jgi:hypothetical protein
MRALTIRQPWAELIPSTYSGQALRGVETIEYGSTELAEVRSRPVAAHELNLVFH